MPISCHLHGTLLLHFGVMLHNLWTFSLFHCCVCWICLLKWDGNECYQHCAIYRSWIIQGNSCHLMDDFFQIHLALYPYLLVTCTTAMRHILVVYAGTVDLLILFLFCDVNAALVFLCTLAWRGGIFVLYSPNQILFQFFPSHSSAISYCSLSTLMRWSACSSDLLFYSKVFN